MYKRQGNDASIETSKFITKKLIIDGANYISNSSLSVDNINVTNKGTLTVNGSIQTTNLLVENGSTLKVTATNSDAIIVKNKGNLHLLGNATITAASGKTGVCFNNPESAIYLKDTSRVTVSGGAYTIGHYNTSNSAKVYYPKNATNANNKITSADGNVLLSYGGLCKITFEQENN